VSTFSPLTQTLDPILFDGHATAPVDSAAARGNWTAMLPVLKARGLMLRELEVGDAESLMAMLTTAEVAKFISPPPTSPQGFEKFIQLVHRERRAGQQFTFGIVPDGCERAVGLVQVRAIAPRFAVGEWGFALG
jgi:RimJ/RimL family protein N-acetyltransferase